jgi:hypothetical protein
VFLRKYPLNGNQPIVTITTLFYAAISAASCATLTGEDLAALLRDIPRHNSFRYISAGTLPEAYFQTAWETMEDPYIYIVLSDTKTPASKVISFFTRDAYNHVSLSFDAALETMVSYNGGNGRNSPGLNRETAGDLCGRPGAGMAVFRLYAGAGKKSLILDRIKRINEEGSSYNRLGLVFKSSVKPNIMFCSQFVYAMLELAGLDYFDKPGGKVKPADFIEAEGARSLVWAYGYSFDIGPGIALKGR